MWFEDWFKRTEGQPTVGKIVFNPAKLEPHTYPWPLDNQPPAVLNRQKVTIDTAPLWKEVTHMSKPDRQVRYTGNFNFTVSAGDPGIAAEKLAELRKHAELDNIRSVNVKQLKNVEGAAS